MNEWKELKRDPLNEARFLVRDDVRIELRDHPTFIAWAGVEDVGEARGDRIHGLSASVARNPIS
jgi:hypothetical protein